MRGKGKRIKSLQADLSDLRMQVEVLKAEVARLRAYQTPIAVLPYDPMRPIGPAPGTTPYPLPSFPQIWCQDDSNDTTASAALADA